MQVRRGAPRSERQWGVAAACTILLFAPQPAKCQWLYEGLDWFVTGDANGNMSRNFDDVIFLVDYHFKSGPPPQPVLMTGDMNCDGRVAVSDIVSLVNYLMRRELWPCSYYGIYYVDTTGQRESELMAMWLSGEIRAPDTLRNRMRLDLDRLRARFGVYHSGVTGVQFYFPWVLTHVLMRAESSTVDSMLAGTYTAWDSLNQEYDLTSFSRLGVSGLWLRFGSESNPGRLAQIYRSLPGVTSSGANSWVGDWPSIYPLQRGDTLTYLFRAAWGDCFAGCAYSKYLYFATLPDSVWWIGDWYPEEEPSPPAWWAEAFENVLNYPYGPYSTLALQPRHVAPHAGP